MKSLGKMQLSRQTAVTDSNSHMFAESNLTIESPSFTRLPSFRPIDSSVSAHSLDSTPHSKGKTFKLGAILATAVSNRGRTQSHDRSIARDESRDSVDRTHVQVSSSTGSIPDNGGNGRINQSHQSFYIRSRSSSIVKQSSMSQDRNRARVASQRNRRRLPGPSITGVNEDNPYIGTVSIPHFEDEGTLNSYELDFLRFAAEGKLDDLRNIFVEQSYYLFHLDVNCVDSLDRTALSLALLNRHLDVVRFLLGEEVGGLELRDALFYAIECEFYEAIDMLLEKDSQTTLQIEPGTTSPFEPGLTPFMLSANKNNYKILSMLYKYNHTLSFDAKDEMMRANSFDAYSWDAVTKRLLHFRARASPAFMLLMYNEKGLTWDPLNTAMDLFGELQLLAKKEREVDEAYLLMAEQCETFALQLLQEVRSGSELADLMRYDLDDDPDDNDDPGETDRVIIKKREKMRNYLKPIEKAIKYKMKDFVTSDNSQLALIYIQKGNLFRKLQGHKAFFAQAALGLMFPLLCIIFLVAPDSDWGRLMRNPTVKFACSVVSELVFVFLLLVNTIMTQYSIASTREEIPPFLIIAYVWIIGKFAQEVREILSQGIREYLSDVWNYNDMSTILLFTFYMLLRLLNKALKVAHVDWPLPVLSPIPLSDVCISIAYILIHLRILELLRAERRFGPLQVSLDLMTRDAIRFFVIFFIIYLAFGSGITELYAPFGAQNKCCCATSVSDTNSTFCATPCKGASDEDQALSRSLFHSLYVMFWTLFGYGEPTTWISINDKCDEYASTRVVGTIILCLYHIIAIIVLVNMLIAMMSNSFQKTHDDSERQWKFHRTQLWLKFIRNEISQPPPMNLIPRPKLIKKFFTAIAKKLRHRCCREEADVNAIEDSLRMQNQARMNRRRTGFDTNKMTETLAGAMYEGETRYSKVLRLVVIRYLKKKVLNKEMVV